MHSSIIHMFKLETTTEVYLYLIAGKTHVISLELYQSDNGTIDTLRNKVAIVAFQPDSQQCSVGNFSITCRYVF